VTGAAGGALGALIPGGSTLVGSVASGAAGGVASGLTSELYDLTPLPAADHTFDTSTVAVNTLIGAATGPLGRNRRAAEGPLLAEPHQVNAVGGRNNCASCVIAGDATWAGYPASAIKLNPDEAFPHGLIRIAKYARNDWMPVTSRTDVEGILGQAGPGARGIVYGARLSTPNQSAHVFNGRNAGGELEFYDFQSGQPGLFEKEFDQMLFIRTN
jgi:hypothetical protein